MDELLSHIVEEENSDKWTLMHRFGAATRVLDEMMQVGAPPLQAPLCALTMLCGGRIGL